MSTTKDTINNMEKPTKAWEKSYKHRKLTKELSPKNVTDSTAHHESTNPIGKLQWILIERKPE